MAQWGWWVWGEGREVRDMEGVLLEGNKNRGQMQDLEES